MSDISPADDKERQRRWRLILGPADNEETAEGISALSEQDQRMDQALTELYDKDRRGGLNDSKPDVARWLGDIRRYFSAPVAQLLQQEALDKIGLRKLLHQPELLAEIEPDIHLLSQILALNRVIPTSTRETAREVVRQVVEALLKQLRFPMEQAIAGSLHRATRVKRPRHKEINWQRTIYTNLKHYQPSHKSIIPETMIGYGRKRSSLKDIIICIDQSGSMAASLVYASLFGAVMASLPALATHLIFFDTSVVDVTNQLDDPVELLFGVRLGGGTNIDRAVGYCQQLVTRPRDTILILISDLFEGGNKEQLYRRMADLTSSGVQVITLLALNDEGTPNFNREVAGQLASLQIPAFACTPTLFPDLMAAALHGRDIRYWATNNDIVVAPNN